MRRHLHQNNFKILKTKQNTYETQSISNLASLNSERTSCENYSTFIKEGKLKGHQRIETWAGGIINRKGSNAIRKNPQVPQDDASSKLSKGYTAYLTSKRITNHSRKKASVGAIGTTDIESKAIIWSKSASKLSRGNQNAENNSETNADSRKSLNLKSQNSKFLNKPENKKLNDRPANLVRSGVVQNIWTPTNLELESGFKTSGILTARTLKQPSIVTDTDKFKQKNAKLEAEYQSSTQDQRWKRVNTKQIRGKARKAETGGKESSSSSSKASLNCPSSLSKSNSRRNEDIGNAKHQK